MGDLFRQNLLRDAAKYSRFALRSIRAHGLAYCLREIVSDLWFDLRNGTRTFLPQELDLTQAPERVRADAVQYQAASSRLVRRLLNLVPRESRGALFVDMGCGKGRVLLLAAQSGFRTLIGLEMEPGLAAACEQNLSRSGIRLRGVDSRCEICDAAMFEFPKGPIVAFLYNPFRGETLRRVVANLGRRARVDPETVWVIYVNPCELIAFESEGFRVVESVCRDGFLVACVLKYYPRASSTASAVEA